MLLTHQKERETKPLIFRDCRRSLPFTLSLQRQPRKDIIAISRLAYIRISPKSALVWIGKYRSRITTRAAHELSISIRVECFRGRWLHVWLEQMLNGLPRGSSRKQREASRFNEIERLYMLEYYKYQMSDLQPFKIS